ncbi:DMT family transporter [Thermogemmatispora sp.]|uniref:DMT family transporter n=1 Tax=Thermogemmatispora sp. TaxID=1968838 RepID=UPI001D8A8E56|nr:EamA family transporter [Thermogemmatispora sp.]MBX5449025.1 EamA family transporter [Thermogemmatispora sp.]
MHTSSKPGDARAALSLIITLLLWASAFTGIRAGLQSYSPGALILLRFLVASLALMLYALLTRMRLPAWRDLPGLLVLGLIGITGYHAGLTFGELTVNAGTASFLVASVPCFTALLALLVLRERLTLWGWLGIAISIVGVTIISLGGKEGLHFTPGALLVLLASLCESVYFIVQKRYMQRYSSSEMTAYTMWAGTLFMLPFAPALWHELPQAAPAATLAVVYLGLFPAAIAYATWAFTLARLPASLATSFLNISPLLALVISWLWLHEMPTLLELLGGLVVIVGVLLVNTRGKLSPASSGPQPPSASRTTTEAEPAAAEGCRAVD